MLCYLSVTLKASADSQNGLWGAVGKGLLPFPESDGASGSPRGQLCPAPGILVWISATAEQ